MARLQAANLLYRRFGADTQAVHVPKFMRSHLAADLKRIHDWLLKVKQAEAAVEGEAAEAAVPSEELQVGGACWKDVGNVRSD